MNRSSNRVLFLAALCIVAVAAFAGCGDSGDSDGADTGGETAVEVPEGFEPIPDADWEVRTGESEVEITTRDNAYLPENVVVTAGTKLAFDNIGRTPHDVAPAIEGQFEAISAEDLQPGDVATLVLDEPGEYPYYCTLHGSATKGMIGRVRVEAAD